MPAVLNSPKASLTNASHSMVNLAFAKKATSDVLQKAEQEKIMLATTNSKAAPGKWSHPTITKAVMATEIQTQDGL